MKRSDLIGIEVVINNSDEAKRFTQLCDEYFIPQADWVGCQYVSGTTRGLVSHELNTEWSGKLVFTKGIEDEDTMLEFTDLKKVDLQSFLQPQFQNGDTLYDTDGSQYMYATSHPLLLDTSILLDSIGELKAIRTSKLTKTPPVTPKDGEWWMCEVVTDETTVTRTTGNVLLYKNDNWVNHRDYLNIKPLYRMIRDTDTE